MYCQAAHTLPTWLSGQDITEAANSGAAGGSRAQKPRYDQPT